MAWGDQADRQEAQRRVDAAISTATVCHMSDAKWRKLFGALRELEIGPLRWKFIRDERVFVEPVPPPCAVLERSLGDVLPYPYGPFREIEWIELGVEQSAEAVEALAALGQFPVQQVDSRVRVVGYTW